MMRRLIAAAAAVVLLAGCDDPPAEPDPTPSSSAASDRATVTASDTPIGQDQAVACPADVVEPDPALPDEVPEGATSVRLCAGGDDEVNAPVDALVTDVASVVTAVNSQRLVSRGCADLRLPSYQLAFGYPDGSRFVVAGRFTGCAELLVGSGRRADAMPPLRTFIRRLVGQRSTATPPEHAVDPGSLDCAQPQEQWTWPLGDPTGLTVAMLCFGDPLHPDKARGVVIPPDDLEVLVASMGTDTSSFAGSLGCTYFARNDHWIVGANEWGDPVTMTRGCSGLAVKREVDWLPRGEARAIVRRLVEKAR